MLNTNGLPVQSLLVKATPFYLVHIVMFYPVHPDYFHLFTFIHFISFLQPLTVFFLS